MDIRIDSGLIPVVLMGLFIFGLGYNTLVSWLIHHGYDEGYTWMLVAGGVLVTVIGLALIMPYAAMLALAAFAASGLPMAVGSWWRHVRRRHAGQTVQRREVLK